jgi:hypothetical protein
LEKLAVRHEGTVYVNEKDMWEKREDRKGENM